MKAIKLLISTPCSNGFLYIQCAASLFHCMTLARDEGLITNSSILFEGKESLIHRARNAAAMYFLEGGFDKLLTIDADISFSYEDFKRIITSDKDIVGGIYPLKTFPIVGNFNPLSDRGGEFFKTNRGMDLDAIEAFRKKYADPETGEAEVRHIPTGFMCVTQRVFAKLSETVEMYLCLDAATGARTKYFHFYPSGVVGHTLESEDWGFSRLATEAGFKTYINTKVLLGHVGWHEYRLGQVYGEVDLNGKSGQT